MSDGIVVQTIIDGIVRFWETGRLPTHVEELLQSPDVRAVLTNHRIEMFQTVVDGIRSGHRTLYARTADEMRRYLTRASAYGAYKDPSRLKPMHTPIWQRINLVVSSMLDLYRTGIVPARLAAAVDLVAVDTEYKEGVRAYIAELVAELERPDSRRTAFVHDDALKIQVFDNLSSLHSRGLRVRELQELAQREADIEAQRQSKSMEDEQRTRDVELARTRRYLRELDRQRDYIESIRRGGGFVYESPCCGCDQRVSAAYNPRCPACRRLICSYCGACSPGCPERV